MRTVLTSILISCCPFFIQAVYLELRRRKNYRNVRILFISLCPVSYTHLDVYKRQTLYYTDAFYGKPVNVVKSNLESVIEGYRGRLKVSLASKTATIINLVLDDVSTARAEDVLNMLIAVYNEDVINDKNQIAVNTSKFINERLIIIERELGSVDANIESFKRENQLTDITSETRCV